MEVLFIGTSQDVKVSVETLARQVGLPYKSKKDIRSGLNASKDGQIVIVDCDLPDGEQDECIESLNRLNNRIITIALVKASDMEGLRRIIDTGVWFFIPKPLEKRTLESVFRKAQIVLFQMLNQNSASIEEFLASRLNVCLQGLNGDEGFSLHNIVISEVEKALISLVLKRTKGNKARAARLLGINRTTLTKKVRDYGL